MLAVAALSLGACAGPVRVGGIIAQDDRVRFLHGDGIIECQVPKAGEVKNCRDLNIVYED
jgi:hypothetical protein